MNKFGKKSGHTMSRMIKTKFYSTSSDICYIYTFKNSIIVLFLSLIIRLLIILPCSFDLGYLALRAMVVLRRWWDLFDVQPVQVMAPLSFFPILCVREQHLESIVLSLRR